MWSGEHATCRSCDCENVRDTSVEAQEREAVTKKDSGVPAGYRAYFRCEWESCAADNCVRDAELDVAYLDTGFGMPPPLNTCPLG